MVSKCMRAARPARYVRDTCEIVVRRPICGLAAPQRPTYEAATRNGGTELNSGQQRAWGARSSAHRAIPWRRLSGLTASDAT